MARLDSLPGDQRAVLSLLLGRGRSYEQIARLLTIAPAAVSDRALAALDALAPDPGLPEVERRRIGDYLLGELPVGDVDAVRALLRDSAPGRAWARTLAGELAPLASEPLPSLPSEPPPAASSGPADAAGTRSAPATRGGSSAISAAPTGGPTRRATAPGDRPAPRSRRSTPGDRPASRPDRPDRSDRPLRPGSRPDRPERDRAANRRPAPAGSTAGAEPAPERPTAAPPASTPGDPTPSPAAERRPGGARESRPSSRRGGAALIVIAVLAIAAIVVLLTRHHGSSSAAGGSRATASAPANPVRTTSSSASSTATPIAQVNLSPTAAGSKTTAIAEILRAGSRREIAIVGQDVPPNTSRDSYEVWLYNSETDATSLGFVSPGVTKNGRLSVAQVLPSDAGRYRELIITTETAGRPTRPGPILLQGRLAGL